jgi:transcriptional regulator with XRE-family HTH domain
MPFPSKKERNRLAQAIYGLRITTGMKQADLALRLEVSLATLVRLEKNEEGGKHIPTLDTLDSLEEIAREHNLPQLADLFAEERKARTQALAPSLGDKLLRSGLVKQIPIEEFGILVLAVRELVEHWDTAKKLVASWRLSEQQMGSWGEVEADIDKQLGITEGMVNPYAAAPSTTVPNTGTTQR